MGSSFSCCGSEKIDQGFVGGNSSWRMFTYKELHAATNGFHEDNKLGEGGFGSVYWGKTSDGLQIAVKKLKAMNYKAEMEFAVEVEVLARLRHKNLLGLRGYCVGTDQRLIVYDYMPNLSLLSHLHGQFASEAHLDWKRRMKIALGSAEGILYLHQEVRPHIIHRDIKASNVLLDSDFEPLVADFGFAKLIPEGVSHMTTRVKGTLGYLAPEYAMWGKVSESCDVFSYGILLLELITGRKPIERLPGGAKRTISEWINITINKDRFKDLADRKLKGHLNWKQFEHVLHLAIMCVQTEPDKRPTIREVVECLKALMADGEHKGSIKPMLMSISSVRCDTDEDEQASREHRGVGDQESFDYGVFSAIEEQKMRDPYKHHENLRMHA
ncbi:PTI1-like tyrosine-protein kinase At3g15890 [Cucurbita pepo subsp. pepo]|uniref:PTI1-like tyrosine-protein kinase At3g15890 n=1 Tax=Cucurbita pepo subsp. pepo TaxID=3664 RepID=UPI000C9D5320|nr:PTI1-like tyrosine-protein kinase At3g15890 [Cucurbita pepo subsp. pepo]